MGLSPRGVFTLHSKKLLFLKEPFLLQGNSWLNFFGTHKPFILKYLLNLFIFSHWNIFSIVMWFEHGVNSLWPDGLCLQKCQSRESASPCAVASEMTSEDTGTQLNKALYCFVRGDAKYLVVLACICELLPSALDFHFISMCDLTVSLKHWLS